MISILSMFRHCYVSCVFLDWLNYCMHGVGVTKLVSSSEDTTAFLCPQDAHRCHLQLKFKERITGIQIKGRDYFLRSVWPTNANICTLSSASPDSLFVSHAKSDTWQTAGITSLANVPEGFLAVGKYLLVFYYRVLLALISIHSGERRMLRWMLSELLES